MLLDKISERLECLEALFTYSLTLLVLVETTTISRYFAREVVLSKISSPNLTSVVRRYVHDERVSILAVPNYPRTRHADDRNRKKSGFDQS